MSINIDNAINQIDRGAEWILCNAKVDKKKSYKVLAQKRRVIKKIRNVCANKASVAIYGQSQCGKSHLSSSLLSADGSPLLVVDRMNNCTHEFLTHLNPQGKNEATGIITRFTTQQQPDISEDYPVHVKLMSIKDIVLMLCDGYYNDIKNHNPFNPERIKDLLNDLRNNTVEQSQRYISEDDIGEIEEYFNNYFSQAIFYALSENETDFFGELSLIIEKLPEEKIIDALCVYWNNDQGMSEKFRQLFNACKQLGFAEDAYISFRELNNAITNNKTLLHVSWLDLNNGTIMSSVRYKQADGNYAVTNISKELLAAICAEVVLEIDPPQLSQENAGGKVEYIKSILNSVDILDFPGARGRGGYLTTAGCEAQIIRRGKVGYYFNKYTAERRINALLFCWEPNVFDAKPMENILRKWVDVAVGCTPDDRSQFMKNMEFPPLFFVGTKFNLLLNPTTADREDNDNALNERWENWFVGQLSQDIIGVPTTTDDNRVNDNYRWFKSWTVESPNFNNCYLLRDFRYSNNIYGGWSLNNRENEERNDDYEPYKGFYERLKGSFNGHHFVQQHFADANSRWDAASNANCDGSLLIACNLASIVTHISKAAADKNKRDVKDAVKRVIEELKIHHYSENEEEKLEKAKDSAARLQASLDVAFGRDPYYFGHFMKAVTITESAVHEAFSRVFPQMAKVANIGNYVFVYAKAPDLNPNNTFEGNLQILRAAYGFNNDDECRRYFERDLQIDLVDLFRRSEFGLQSPSQLLAATLKTCWFDEWLRGTRSKTLTDMLGEVPYKELVDMLQSLFEKYKIERRVAHTIHGYVDEFGVNVKNLGEMIADICAEMLNKFVQTVGYEYYSKEDGVVDAINEISARHNLGLDFHFVEGGNPIPIIADDVHHNNIAEVMTMMDDTVGIQNLLRDPNEHSIDDLARVIPGFRQSCRWRDLAKIGYIITSDIPHYDIETNNSLGQIIRECETINNE